MKKGMQRKEQSKQGQPNLTCLQNCSTLHKKSSEKSVQPSCRSQRQWPETDCQARLGEFVGVCQLPILTEGLSLEFTTSVAVCAQDALVPP